MTDPDIPQDTGQSAYGNSGETNGGDPDPNGTHRTDTGIGAKDDDENTADAAAAQGSEGGGELGS